MKRLVVSLVWTGAILFGLIVALLTGSPVGAATFTVTSTNDSGLGSLRQAILEANLLPGTDTIAFSIGGGAQTISPTSGLPPVIDPVVIDGTTQPGYAGTPMIELNGASAGAFTAGISVTAGSSTIRGLAINRFSGPDVSFQLNGGNRLEACFVGTDPTGSTAVGGGGVAIGTAPSNVVQGNLL